MSYSQLKSVLTTDHNVYNDSKLKTRNLSLDFARGMAVIFMVFVHVLSTYASESVQYSPFGYIIDFLGGPPAAPVFMFAMGIFFVLSSRSQSMFKGILKGFMLLLVGIVLSFLRYDILTIFTEGFNTVNISSTGNIIAFWEVDILQFAGCAYILMSIIKRLFNKPIYWLLIGTVVMIISPYIWGIESNIGIINWIFNYIWGYTDLVYFPLFGWLYYPLIGMVFGVMIKSSKDIDKLFRSLIKPGLVLLLIGSIITATNFDFHIGDYFHSGQGSMIWIMGFVLIWLWLISKIVNKAPNSKVVNIVNYFGKNTTSIYIIHWLLVSWATLLLGEMCYGYIITSLLMIVILTVSTLISKLIKIKL